jgi:multimeric flavodoxin WrbA
MSKNILVLTGSPRKNGNTDLLAQAFIEGAIEAGHQVERYDAGRKMIHGCTACDACWSKGTACVFTDGFTELEPMLEAADVLVIASPLYWSTFPAQLKAAIDKLYAYVSPACQLPLKIKESALLACGELEGEQIFKGMVETYLGIADYLAWLNRGIIRVPEVFAKGDILKTDALEKAKTLGKSI